MVRLSKSSSLCFLALFVLLFCLVGTTSLFAKSFANRTSDIGISGGFWLSGDIDVGESKEDIKKDSSFMFRAIADAYLMPKFAVGAFVNYSQPDVSYYTLKAKTTMFEWGVSLKPRFLMSPTVALKPGLGLGYRKISIDSIEGYDADFDSEGLGVNLSCEIQVNVGQFVFYIEPGFLTQPAGGNDYTDITFAPIWYILAGVAF